MDGALHARWSTLVKIILFLPMRLTLGRFALVVNACLLYTTDKVLDNFTMDSRFTTFIGATLLTILNGMGAGLRL
jgi:uncharacterized membrane protein YvlD (DUF360 family)